MPTPSTEVRYTPSMLGSYASPPGAPIGSGPGLSRLSPLCAQRRAAASYPSQFRKQHTQRHCFRARLAQSKIGFAVQMVKLVVNGNRGGLRHEGAIGKANGLLCLFN